mmetsp:Transcript_51507/g.167107  ORF Transcript_51507/g.167107 Transcript_51507/m.167107 type:complete len:256 (-) Transcript_51507:54-821(-)
MLPAVVGEVRLEADELIHDLPNLVLRCYLRFHQIQLHFRGLLRIALLAGRGVGEVHRATTRAKPLLSLRFWLLLGLCFLCARFRAACFRAVRRILHVRDDILPVCRLLSLRRRRLRGRGLGCRRRLRGCGLGCTCHQGPVAPCVLSASPRGGTAHGGRTTSDGCKGGGAEDGGRSVEPWLRRALSSEGDLLLGRLHQMLHRRLAVAQGGRCCEGHAMEQAARAEPHTCRQDRADCARHRTTACLLCRHCWPRRPG